jgi:hypothetical protein
MFLNIDIKSMNDLGSQGINTLFADLSNLKNLNSLELYLSYIYFILIKMINFY